MNPTTQVCLYLFTSDLACRDSFSVTESAVVFGSSLEILGMTHGSNVCVYPHKGAESLSYGFAACSDNSEVFGAGVYASLVTALFTYAERSRLNSDRR